MGFIGICISIFQEEVLDDQSLKEMGQDLLRLGSVIHYENKLRPEEKFRNYSLIFFIKNFHWIIKTFTEYCQSKV